MEISIGFVMLCGGIAGAIICFALLALTGIIFPRQQKRLLEQLQKEP